MMHVGKQFQEQSVLTTMRYGYSEQVWLKRVVPKRILGQKQPRRHEEQSLKQPQSPEFHGCRFNESNLAQV